MRILALCQREQGNEARAVQTMERALGLRPEDILLNNDVAYSWIDQGVRLDEAEPMIRFALGFRPRQGAYLDTYGWLLYKKGDFAGAKRWLIRGLHARGNEDPVVSDHLGDACWRLGEKTEAIKYWKAATAIIGDRKAEDLGSDDERRVRETAPKKVTAAETGGSPEVSPLARPSDPADAADDKNAKPKAE